MHARRIVHCDLKPQNGFMADGGQLKIGHFRLSMDLDVDIDSPFIRKCRDTPNYIAPESVNRQIPTDKADMWSLGVLLYRIVVGQPHFHSQSLKTTLTRVRAPWTLAYQRK